MRFVSSSSSGLCLLFVISLLACQHTVTDALINDTIHIAYFMTSDPYRAAAINLAIERARDEGIWSQHNFRSMHNYFA